MIASLCFFFFGLVSRSELRQVQLHNADIATDAQFQSGQMIVGEKKCVNIKNR